MRTLKEASITESRLNPECLIERVKILGIGLLVGLIGAVTGARLIEGLLYGVSPFDLPSLGTSILVLGLAATLACLIPALKAVRIKPTEALRE